MEKANRLDPASKQSSVKFFLWNNMGFIAAVVCFLPVVILLLANKDLDAKTKKIVTVVAVIALILASVFSIDFNPVSAEEEKKSSGKKKTSSSGKKKTTTSGKKKTTASGKKTTSSGKKTTSTGKKTATTKKSAKKEDDAAELLGSVLGSLLGGKK